MIRPFDLRDISLVRQLQPQAIVLDNRMALTGLHRPLQDALLAYFFAVRGTPTSICRLQQSGITWRAFGQMRLCRDRSQARLVTMAVHPDGHELSICLQMLDEMTAQAGRYGAQAIIAEVGDSHPLFQVLRRADFAVYTRQEIWRLDESASQPATRQLRPVKAGDRWQVQQLIGSTTPPLIRPIETADQADTGWVWISEGKLLGYVYTHAGRRGV